MIVEAFALQDHSRFGHSSQKPHTWKNFRHLILILEDEFTWGRMRLPNLHNPRLTEGDVLPIASVEN
ncbi:hypothetical protein AD946_06730 [Gluconobacter thailandicus]|nr:hypothetical protein AD946_06730 [Gluconobacter thailandicus]